MKYWFLVVLWAGTLLGCKEELPGKIDRYALVKRNNPLVTEVEELSALSVGNGNFAVTVDAMGLQTFPDFYAKGVPLGTQAQWGWHSFPNPEGFRFEETLKDYDFRGKPEPYAVQFSEPGRSKEAANWFRANPHRLHLGYVGFEAEGLRPSDIQNPHQELDLWNGAIHIRFALFGDSVAVKTAVAPNRDVLAAALSSPLLERGELGISFPLSKWSAYR